MYRLLCCGLIPTLTWLASPPLALAQPPPPRSERGRPGPHESELTNLLREVSPAHVGDDPLDSDRERAKGKFALARTSAPQLAEVRVRVARLGLALELERIRLGQSTISRDDSGIGG